MIFAVTGASFKFVTVKLKLLSPAITPSLAVIVMRAPPTAFASGVSVNSQLLTPLDEIVILEFCTKLVLSDVAVISVAQFMSGVWENTTPLKVVSSFIT